MLRLEIFHLLQPMCQLLDVVFNQHELGDLGLSQLLPVLLLLLLLLEPLKQGGHFTVDLAVLVFDRVLEQPSEDEHVEIVLEGWFGVEPVQFFVSRMKNGCPPPTNRESVGAQSSGIESGLKDFRAEQSLAVQHLLRPTLACSCTSCLVA